MVSRVFCSLTIRKYLKFKQYPSVAAEEDTGNTVHGGGLEQWQQPEDFHINIHINISELNFTMHFHQHYCCNIWYISQK